MAAQDMYRSDRGRPPRSYCRTFMSLRLSPKIQRTDLRSSYAWPPIADGRLKNTCAP